MKSVSAKRNNNEFSFYLDQIKTFQLENIVQMHIRASHRVSTFLEEDIMMM